MNAVFESGNLELIEKYHQQQDVRRVRRRSAKAARAAKYFKRLASKNPKMPKSEEKPTTTEERAQKKTSLARTLPAVSKVVQAPLLRQLREDTGNGNGKIPAVDTLALDPPELSTAILQTFEKVSARLLAGEDLDPLKDEVVKMLHGLDEKIVINEGILALCQSHRLTALGRENRDSVFIP